MGDVLLRWTGLVKWDIMKMKKFVIGDNPMSSS